ncbi:hypothetical protein PIROE2DRAFT_1203 [Piromyces sp. E2]|nr:hypothetical protein PIROE2DRAFT_1203 [Piromyces sp. E2]|eukprot:OUM70663.1 hypothetical protein PIROE2DRAFT_1203 [Piromyces sp. E2]
MQNYYEVIIAFNSKKYEEEFSAVDGSRVMSQWIINEQTGGIKVKLKNMFFKFSCSTSHFLSYPVMIYFTIERTRYQNTDVNLSNNNIIISTELIPYATLFDMQPSNVFRDINKEFILYHCKDINHIFNTLCNLISYIKLFNVDHVVNT